MVRDGETLHALFEHCDLFLCQGDDAIDGVDIGGFRISANGVDVDVFRDFDVTLRDGLQEQRLR